MSLITLKDLYKIYKTGAEEVYALAGVSLHIEANEYLALTGESGSGKSTLMNILGCLDTPTEGQYLLDGISITEYSDDELATLRNKKIGFIFQTFNLIPRMNALENVGMPLIYSGFSREERNEKAYEMLNKVGLKDRSQHKPEELSGGQKQRVAIARALVNKPSILLADEPTGNLDSKTTDEIMGLFDELHRQGNTIILVTHEPNIAEKTRRNIVLRDGHIISDQYINIEAHHNAPSQ